MALTHDATGRYKTGKVSTTNATGTVVTDATVSIPTGRKVVFKLVTIFTDTGTGDVGGTVVYGVAKNVAGTASVIGLDAASTSGREGTVTTASATVAANSGNIRPVVSGLIATNIDWLAKLTILEEVH